MQRALQESRVQFTTLLKTISDEWDDTGKDSCGRPGGRLDLNELGETQWMQFFRFTRAEVELLAEALDLPESVVVPENQISEDRITALCMLLRRLAYPCRLVDMELEFGWESSRISRITRFTATLIWDRWKHLLRFDAERLTPTTLAGFSEAFVNKGCPADFIAAIIDGTLKKVARPSLNQRILFNGWKRIHCLKYHLVVTPDGIIIHVFGPVEGRRHDATVLKQSGLTALLDKHFWGPNNERYFVYGDPAYQTAGHLMAPYKGAHITDGQKRWNEKMSKIREPVEWMFKETIKKPFYNPADYSTWLPYSSPMRTQSSIDRKLRNIFIVRRLHF